MAARNKKRAAQAQQMKGGEDVEMAFSKERR